MTTTIFNFTATISRDRWDLRVTTRPEPRSRGLRERWSEWLRAVPASPPRRAVPFVSARLARLGADEIAALPRTDRRPGGARRVDLAAHLRHT